MNNETERQIFEQMNNLLNQHDDLYKDELLSSRQQKDYFLYQIFCDSVIENIEK